MSIWVIESCPESFDNDSFIAEWIRQEDFRVLHFRYSEAVEELVACKKYFGNDHNFRVKEYRRV